ncbi:MAG: exodeoxyribonuclease VII large subunit [Candidatus Nanopelagicales bacterium]|jgi:exodeoxyribonuclease VII large subunit
MKSGQSPEEAIQVKDASRALSEVISSMPSVWIEGQITSIKIRPGSDWVFVDLRDVSAEATLNVVFNRSVLDDAPSEIESGQRVLVHGKPEFWMNRGSLVFRARRIQPVGLGELMIALEKLKQQLLKEGLFAPEKKKPIPFLPKKIGLICGRASAAMKDVMENTRLRWPGIKFDVHEVAVQGVKSSSEVRAALAQLNAENEVEVIVITRGGGSFEDLLPFSDEMLLRAVAASNIPVISAIGHEQDNPLLDYVADLRASTPTDAASKLVPDLEDEIELIDDWVFRMREIIANRIEREQTSLERLLEKSALDSPKEFIQSHRDVIIDLKTNLRNLISTKIYTEQTWFKPRLAQLRTLSPLSTLARGFALVQKNDGKLVRKESDVNSGDLLKIRLEKDSLQVEVKK